MGGRHRAGPRTHRPRRWGPLAGHPGQPGEALERSGRSARAPQRPEKVRHAGSAPRHHRQGLGLSLCRCCAQPGATLE